MRVFNILKPSKKKLIVLGLIILTIILGFNYFGREKQTPFRFVEVKRQDIRASVFSSGVLTGTNIVNLKFRSSGKLAYINVKVGDKVNNGQRVAGLDTQDLNIVLQQAQNTLRDKQAIALKAEDDVKDHTSDESFAQKVTRTTAQVARDSAFDSVKAAQRDFQDAIISSPITGLVTKVNFVPGQIVGGGDIIAEVVDTTNLYFDTDVDEADIGSITVGQISEITLDSYPQKVFSGKVDQLLPQTKQTSSGATVITVRIKLDNPGITFVNGLSGQASITIAESKNTLVVPQEALRDDNTVVMQDGQGLRPLKITPGIMSDTDVEIKEGLEENNRIILNPPAITSGINQNRSNNPLGGVFRALRGGNR